MKKRNVIQISFLIITFIEKKKPLMEDIIDTIRGPYHPVGKVNYVWILIYATITVIEFVFQPFFLCFYDFKYISMIS